VLGLIFGVLEGPDAVAAVPGSSDFGRSATPWTRRTSATR
jgi:hypothetical protein